MDENPAPEYWRALDRKAEVILPFDFEFLHACLLFISFICRRHCLDLKEGKVQDIQTCRGQDLHPSG
jgi:hypothetical protein